MEDNTTDVSTTSPPAQKLENNTTNVSATSPPVQKKVQKRKKKKGRQPAPIEKESVEAWWVLKNKSKDQEKMQEDEETISISLKFVTKQSQYAIPKAPIAVSENGGSEQLNRVIYSFLERGGIVTVIPKFEFLIGKKMLVGTLKQHLTELGISFETTTQVEYFERFPPPAPKDNLEHDDWVSSVMSDGQWLVTGCYDNTVQLWSIGDMENGLGKRAHRLTIPAHKAPVKAVSWLRTEGDIKSFVSCSIDQTAIVWDWDSKLNSVECVWECRGHSQSVECLGVESQGTLFATGSWDNSIKIWDGVSKGNSDAATEKQAEEEEPDMKKAKKNRQQRLKTPVMTLVGHSESVSGVDWIDDLHFVSSSWDHSIRMWDLEMNGMVSQISGNVAFFCLSYSKLNKTLLAGCADRNVRLYDPRASEGSIAQNKFTSHSKWVPSVRWSKHDQNMFVSGSYDNTIRVWDRRSSKAPLYNLLGHSEKVLSVDWSFPKHIASGSADCTAQIYST